MREDNEFMDKDAAFKDRKAGATRKLGYKKKVC